MPIALDGDTIDVYLKSDVSKPIETRPAFVCRYLTCRQVREYHKALKAYAQAIDSNAENMIELGVATVCVAVMSTRNLPDKPLDELLSDSELWELATEIPMVITLSEQDKKKLLSASLSTGVNSEPVASTKTESGTAPTAPAITALSL